jgi:hypothetical protein
MANEDLHSLSDIDLVHSKYNNRNKIYAANVAIKANPGDNNAQAALHDATERQQAIEDHISHRIARSNVSDPSTGL